MLIDSAAQSDARPSPIKFERKPVENRAESLAKGHYVAVDVDFVHVKVPGSIDIHINKVKNWFSILEQDVQNSRIPEKWLHDYRDAYERWKSGQELPLNGMPIKGWGLISPAQQETLIRLGVLTVEDLAALNDEGIRRIGMGGLELKNKAQTALRATKDIGPVIAENAELKKRLDLAEKNVAAMQQQLAILTEQSQSSAEVSASDLLSDEPESGETLEDAPVKRGPGRPKKVA